MSTGVIYDKKHGKSEIEFNTFRHMHNYVLPKVNKKILKRFWLNNLENNSYKYNINLKFSKI